jgi:hypothetical protein
MGAQETAAEGAKCNGRDRQDPFGVTRIATNLITVRPEQGTELVEGPVSKGHCGEPFDRLRAGLRQAQPERVGAANGALQRFIKGAALKT